MRQTVLTVAFCATTLLLLAGCTVHRSIVHTKDSVTEFRSVTMNEGSITIEEGDIQINGFHFGGDKASHTVTRSVSANAVQTVKVHTDFGAVIVEPTSDAKQIGVTATVQLSDNNRSKADREKYLRGFTIPNSLSGSTYVVRVEPPQNLPKNIGWTVSYRVTVPPSVALDLKSDNGAIVVRDTNTKGKVLAQSDFGEIKITNAGNVVEATTENGAVTIVGKTERDSVTARSSFGAIAVTGPSKTIEAKTENGAVHIQGARNAKKVTARSSFGAIALENVGGNVNAQTENGAVKYSGTPTALVLKSEFGSVEASLNDCATLTEAEMTTENGAVALSLPATASVALTGHTENGSINTNGFQADTTGDSFDKSFTAKWNGGKVPVRLSTTFGSLNVTIR